MSRTMNSAFLILHNDVVVFQLGFKFMRQVVAIEWNPDFSNHRFYLEPNLVYLGFASLNRGVARNF